MSVKEISQIYLDLGQRVFQRSCLRGGYLRAFNRQRDGDLGNDLIAPAPLLSYLRYNVDLERDTLSNGLGLGVSSPEVAPLSKTGDPANMARLKQIGELVSEGNVSGKDFPTAFDLTP